MKIIVCFFLILGLAVSFRTWKTSLDTQLLNSRIEEAQREAGELARELEGLEEYREEKGTSLEKLYLEVFGDIKHICSYYHADSEVRIAGAEDLVNTQEFFGESQYKGINYVELQVQVDLKGQPDTHLINLLCNMAKSRPIEISQLNLEKNILNLTMRLYGT